MRDGERQPIPLRALLRPLVLLAAVAVARGQDRPPGWPADGPWHIREKYQAWTGEGELDQNERYGSRWVTRAVANRRGAGLSQLIWFATGYDGRPRERLTEQFTLDDRYCSSPGPDPATDTDSIEAVVVYVSPNNGPRPGSQVLATGLIPTTGSAAKAVADEVKMEWLRPEGISLRGQPMVVIDAPGLAQRPREAEALLACPRWSGCLVLSRPAWADLPANSALARCLPRDGQGHLRPDAVAVAGHPPLAARPEGHGWIVQLDGPVPLDADYWQRMALNFGSRAAPEPHHGTDFPQPERVVRFLDPAPAMPIGALAAYLLAYVLLMVTALRLARDLPRLRWLGAPLLATAFVPVAAVVREHTARRTTDLSVFTQATAVSGQRTADLLGAVHLGSAGTRDYALRLGGAWPWPRYESGQPTIVLTSDRQPLGVTNWHLRGGNEDVLRTANVGDLGGTVELALRRAGDKVTGHVRKRLPCPLRAAVLVVGDRCASLGDLPAGAAAAVPTDSNCWSQAWPYSVVGALTSGSSQSRPEQAVAALSRGRRDGLEGLGKDQAELLAWVDRSWAPVEMSPRPDSERCLTLLRVQGTVALDGQCTGSQAGPARRLSLSAGGETGAWCTVVFPATGQRITGLRVTSAPSRPQWAWNRRRQRWQQPDLDGRLRPAADFLAGHTLALRCGLVDRTGAAIDLGVTAELASPQTDGQAGALP